MLSGWRQVQVTYVPQNWADESCANSKALFPGRNASNLGTLSSEFADNQALLLQPMPQQAHHQPTPNCRRAQGW